MAMFRRIRKGWEIAANGVIVRVVRGRAEVQIDADKTAKIEVRKPGKSSGLRKRRKSV